MTALDDATLTKRRIEAAVTQAQVNASVSGESPQQIATDYPVSATTIYAIRAGRKWAHVS